MLLLTLWLLVALLLAVLFQGRRIMATVAQLNEKLDTIDTNLTEIAEDLAEVVAGLPEEGGLNAAEVSALSDRLDGIVTRTRTIGDVVAEPPVEPPV